jgi:hypothetical protein
MRAILLVASLLLASTVVLVAAPSAEAVGTCTSLNNASVPPDGPHCPALLCIGTAWSYGEYYYRCQTEIPPDPICACMPI